MKRYIYLIFILVLTNCTINSDHKLLEIRNDNVFWRINTTSNEVATITAVETDTIKKMVSTVIKVSLSSALTNVNKKTCSEFVQKHKGDKMLLTFSSLSEPQKNKYQFNSANVYLKTSTQKYHLKLIDKYTEKQLDYNINNVNDNGYYKNNHYYSPAFYYYHLPIICERLDGASIEISGIYKNGKELPPIKFQINLLDNSKKY